MRATLPLAILFLSSCASTIQTQADSDSLLHESTNEAASEPLAYNDMAYNDTHTLTETTKIEGASMEPEITLSAWNSTDLQPFIASEELEESIVQASNTPQKDLSCNENSIPLLSQQEGKSIFFSTGEDAVNVSDLELLAPLLEELQGNPTTKIQVIGHTDPRGTEEYNNVLSLERAKSVAELLTKSGIETSRIEFFGCADRYSNASKGDHSAYAHDRRVDIIVEESSISDLAKR